MSRVRFECVPCGTVSLVGVLDVVLSEDGAVRMGCPVCGARVVCWLPASVWWEVACLRASVRDELEMFARVLERVRTPADIGGGM